MALASTISHYGSWLPDGFLIIYEWVVKTNKMLPNAVPSGFVMTYAMALLFMPVLLYGVLSMVWAVAEVGSTRKSMTTFFVVVVGIPLYPVLTILVNAILWLVIGVLGLTLAVLGPVALLMFGWINLISAKHGFLERQRKRLRKRKKRGLDTDDLTCCELLWGLTVGIFGLCSFGVVAVALTLLKSPLVVSSFIFRTIARSVRWWFEFVKCCLPDLPDADEEHVNTAVQDFVTVKIDGVECRICDLKEQGYNAAELKSKGASAGDLKACGYTLRQLVDAGFKPSCLYHLGFSPVSVHRLEEEQFRDVSCGEDRSYMWVWFPLIVLAWLIGLACGICVVILALVVLALSKAIAATIWPAWIAAGWIRLFNKDFGRRRNEECCTPLVQGMKAGYQVVWAGDTFLNVCIAGRLDLIWQIRDEFLDVAKGDRAELSPECARMSLLPPVVVGLFQDSWDLKLRALASQLGVSENAVQEAWRALARGMIRLGREAIDAGLLTEEWAGEVPSELCLGLPARALLETVERSPPEEMVLASGLRLTGASRPNDGFSSKIWSYFQEAQKARAALQLSPGDRDLLCAALLAGGGDADSLPEGLAEALHCYEELPPEVHAACQAVFQPLLAIAVECSRRSAFKDKLKLVIEGIVTADSSAYAFVTSPEFNPPDALAPDVSDSSGSESQALVGSESDSSGP